MSPDYLANLLKQTYSTSNPNMRLTHEGQIYFAENFSRFRDYFMNFFARFQNTNQKITQKEVEEFKEGLAQLNAERLGFGKPTQ
jgi:hypothetical protein